VENVFSRIIEMNKLFMNSFEKRKMKSIKFFLDMFSYTFTVFLEKSQKNMYLAEVMCKLSSEPALLHLLSEAADSTTLGFLRAGCCCGGIGRG